MTRDELQRLVDKATQGPWQTDEADHDAPHQDIRIGPEGDYRACRVWQDDAAHDFNPEQRANAALIAASPTMARQLLAGPTLEQVEQWRRILEVADNEWDYSDTLLEMDVVIQRMKEAGE